MYFKESKFFTVYIVELMRLAAEIKEKCNLIFEESKIPERGFLIQSSPNVHTNINYVLTNAANIKKLAFSHPKRGKKETQIRYKARMERSDFLKGLLEGIDISEILKTNVRNSIEHFDEFLDDLVFEEKAGKTLLPAAYNMVFSSLDFMKPRIYPIRTYISEEKKYYNFDICVDIGKMHKESEMIFIRLSQVMQMDEPMGMIIPG